MKTWGVTAYRLKKNLIPRFDNNIREIPSNKAKLQKWKTYSLTLLDENLDRAKDTWCSPHCLNAVHEEANDECAHEKQRVGRFRLRCRGTSLQASSEGTRTPLRTKPWLAMQAAFFSRSSSELLLEVVDESNRAAFSARSGANYRDGWWWVCQKLARGETKSSDAVKLKR
jgi:hypothetical protein